MSVPLNLNVMSASVLPELGSSQGAFRFEKVLEHLPKHVVE